MEATQIPIRLLEMEIASIQYKMRADGQTDDELEESHLLIEITEHYIADLNRLLVDKRAATLEELAQLKVGIRLADVLLDRMRETNEEALAGWQYGWNANPMQSRYSFVYELAMRLGWSIADIERHYPEYATWFDAERAEYRLLCEQDKQGQQLTQ